MFKSLSNFVKMSIKQNFKPIQKLKEITIPSKKFPCKSCVILSCCTKPCEKIELDNKKLKELFLKYNACPDCGCESFTEGPSGGAAMNVMCNGCRHYFNFGLPLFIHRISCDKNNFYPGFMD